MNPDQTVSYLIANTPVGSRVPVDLIRNGRRQTVQVTVGQRPTEEELARQLGVDQDQEPTPESGDRAAPAEASARAVRCSR